jgi:hypothetical protein
MKMKTKMNCIIQDGEGAHKIQRRLHTTHLVLSVFMPLLFSINFSELPVIHGYYKLTDKVEPLSMLMEHRCCL